MPGARPERTHASRGRQPNPERTRHDAVDRARGPHRARPRLHRPDAGVRAVRRRGLAGRRRAAVRVRAARDRGRRHPRARARARTSTPSRRSTGCCRATTAGRIGTDRPAMARTTCCRCSRAPSITVPVVGGRLALGTGSRSRSSTPTRTTPTRRVRLSFPRRLDRRSPGPWPAACLRPARAHRTVLVRGAPTGTGDTLAARLARPRGPPRGQARIRPWVYSAP